MFIPNYSSVFLHISHFYFAFYGNRNIRYLGSLPYDYGHYNDLEHYNTYSNKNYIPPSYRVNELFPNVGVLSSVLKNR